MRILKDYADSNNIRRRSKLEKRKYNFIQLYHKCIKVEKNRGYFIDKKHRHIQSANSRPDPQSKRGNYTQMVNLSRSKKYL